MMIWLFLGVVAVVLYLALVSLVFWQKYSTDQAGVTDRRVWDLFKTKNAKPDRLIPSGKEQPELFRTIFESAPECINLQKQDGIVELINRSGLDLLETKLPSSIEGKPIYNLIAPNHHSVYKAMTESVFQGEQGNLEYEIVTLKGNKRWMKTNAVPLRDSENRIISLMSITRDITETRHISQQLETHRNKLQTIIESEPECVKLQDAFGTIIEMNPAGLSLLNAKRQEDVIGKTIYEFMTPEYKAQYQTLTDDVFKGGCGSMEFEVVSLNGRRRWLETHAAPLVDNTGNVSALLAITRDIDERKNNEARLYQQQTELARVCRLSTMGEMASSLAHELNQPLCAISSYAESANLLGSSSVSSASSSSAELEELLEKIVDQSLRATQIIQNIRDFVRKQTPKPEAILISSTIKSVIEFVEPAIRKYKIQTDLQIANDLLSVKADRVQIEQVMLNLITNAIHAVQELPETSRKINIHIENYSEQEVLFKVSNSGLNIPDKIVDQLFTPFYTTKATGMGMGLSISRSIVEAHNGEIWYKPIANFGPCFKFTLPAE